MRVAPAALEKDAIGDVETLLARGAAAEKCASQEAWGDGRREEQKPQPVAFESRRPGFQLKPPCQVMGLVPAEGLGPPASAAPHGPAAGCNTCVAPFSCERVASSMVAETAVAREGEEDVKFDPSPTVQAWSPWAGELGTYAKKEQGAGDKRSASDAAMEDECARPGSLFDKQRAKLNGAEAVPGLGGKLAVHRDDGLAPQHMTSVDEKQAASNPKHRLCPHQRRRSSCKDCGGSSICPHKRRRSQCKDCGGGSICQHKRERTKCKECGGKSLCAHARQKSQCKECRGVRALLAAADELTASTASGDAAESSAIRIMGAL